MAPHANHGGSIVLCVMATEIKYTEYVMSSSGDYDQKKKKKEKPNQLIEAADEPYF